MGLGLIMAGVGLVQAYMQKKAGDEAQDAANESAAQSASQAKLGRDQALQDLQAQLGETNVSANKSKVLRLMQGLRDRAFMTSALAEGIGTRRSLAAAGTALGADIGALEFSRQSAMGQYARQKQSINSGLQSSLLQINAQAAQFRAPSALSSALNIGLAGFSGYTTGKTLEAKYPTGLPKTQQVRTPDTTYNPFQLLPTIQQAGGI